MSDPSNNAESVFGQAIEIEAAEERDAFLQQACGDDQQLRAEVEKLVADHFRAGSFMEVPIPSADITVTTHPAGLREGSQIGPYKLRERLGEGGMGVVWAAEQRNPVRRKVALKLIKPGMATDAVIARFEAERQALALMDHQNIARIFDGGSTDTGQPYFVMELIRGLPITEYCDRNNFSIEQRLRLFAAVCHAVQHAHQKGIIHRDIKPSNVLVTLHDGKPVSKIIDFGVAKALNQQLTEKTLYTRVHQAVGTLAYMSPEQAELSGLDIDTRADIYGLGVLLYELLTGTPPFDPRTLEAAAFHEACRIIREEDPPKASTRISSLGASATGISSHRQTDPTRLRQLVHGDLDWILMKSLDKDRTRRYQSANDLAADLLYYLDDKPVTARPPSAWYQFRKYARRNQGLMLSAALVSIMLLLAIAGLGTGYVISRRSEAKLQETVDDLQQTKERLSKSLEDAEKERQKARSILFDKVLMYALSGDVELTEIALVDAVDVGLSEALCEFAIALAHTWNGDHEAARIHYATALELGGPSFAIQASELQVIPTDQHFYEKVLRLRESRPADAFDQIFRVQAEAWYTPQKAVAALEDCGEWKNSTLALYFGALAHANHALMVHDLTEAEDSIKDLEKLLKWYPGNKLPLCGTLYTSLCARNIALRVGEEERAAIHAQAAKQAAEALATIEHADVFWVVRSRAWCFAEFEEGSAALTEWKKRMGREPLGIDPMHYAACCCLFGDENTCSRAIDELPNAFDAKNAHAHLAKAYLLALSNADDETIAASCDSLLRLQDPRREIQCGAVEVWLAHGNLERARETARELMRQESPRGNEHWDAFLQFIASNQDNDEFISRFEAANPPAFQAMAEYLAGIKSFAEGHDEQARREFRECRDSGRVFASWYWWSKVFLRRLDKSI